LFLTRNRDYYLSNYLKAVSSSSGEDSDRARLGEDLHAGCTRLADCHGRDLAVGRHGRLKMIVDAKQVAVMLIVRIGAVHKEMAKEILFRCLYDLKYIYIFVE
jgi:hypothetical protein